MNMRLRGLHEHEGAWQAEAANGLLTSQVNTDSTFPHRLHGTYTTFLVTLSAVSSSGGLDAACLRFMSNYS
jgi:hypothetical protein